MPSRQRDPIVFDDSAATASRGDPGETQGGAASFKRVIVLGSTGSIGTQTLDVLAQLNAQHERGEQPTRYEVAGLCAGRNAGLLGEQAMAHAPECVALADGDGTLPGVPNGARTLTGPDAAERLVREVDADLVVAAMVGRAGLPATLAAIELGRDVALANKETLVAAGELVIREALRTGARLLPVDSEHSGLWQCLHGVPGEDGLAPCPPCTLPAGVARVVLTASGGPFRTWDAGRIAGATPEDALEHPTWKMGAKNTIDSASLMNKGLEVIEAAWLFGIEPDAIGVLVHRSSIVHAIVEFADGSVLCQLSDPDMRLPIQHAVQHPIRSRAAGRRLDLDSLTTLHFEPPDHDRFPALGLAYRALRTGGTSGAVLNGANERAVQAFLDERLIPFGRIPELVDQAMGSVSSSPIRDLDDVFEADAQARSAVEAALC